MKAIGIDLGGTRIKGVAIDNSGAVLCQAYTPTNDTIGENWKSAIQQTINDLLQQCGKTDLLIGISAPGIPDAANQAISFMPGRLQGLEQFNWGEYLGSKTFVMNDAIAALAAEAKFGSAKGIKNAILLTLGTGVGGAVLIEGKIYQGAFQKAGHLGHLSVNHRGERDICNLPGSLEDAIGNCTIAKRSFHKYQFTHELLEDYRKGDDFATWLWLDAIQQLAVGISSLTNILSPEVVIIGGGMSAANEDLFRPLEKFMELYEWRAGGNHTRIVKATFGDLAGAIGAASFTIMQTENS